MKPMHSSCNLTSTALSFSSTRCVHTAADQTVTFWLHAHRLPVPPRHSWPGMSSPSAGTLHESSYSVLPSGPSVRLDGSDLCGERLHTASRPLSRSQTCRFSMRYEHRATDCVPEAAESLTQTNMARVDGVCNAAAARTLREIPSRQSGPRRASSVRCATAEPSHCQLALSDLNTRSPGTDIVKSGPPANEHDSSD